LNDIFSAFDRIVDLFNCERIKTIGDGYVAVSGLPEATPDHARNIAKVALRMRRYHSSIACPFCFQFRRPGSWLDGGAKPLLRRHLQFELRGSSQLRWQVANDPRPFSQ
jgi:hypothetical protein